MVKWPARLSEGNFNPGLLVRAYATGVEGSPTSAVIQEAKEIMALLQKFVVNLEKTV